MIGFLCRAVLAHVFGPHCAYPDLAHSAVMQVMQEEEARLLADAVV